jgi:hypothetical protein
MKYLRGDEAGKYLISKTLSGSVEWDVSVKKMQFEKAQTIVKEGNKRVKVELNERGIVINGQKESVTNNLLIDLWKIVQLLSVKKIERQVLSH